MIWSSQACIGIGVRVIVGGMMADVTWSKELTYEKKQFMHCMVDLCRISFDGLLRYP